MSRRRGSGGPRKRRTSSRERRSSRWEGGIRSPAGRLLLYAVAAILLGSGGGYLYATQVVFPAPDRADEEFRTVPDLRGMTLEAAEDRLIAEQLIVAGVDSIRHPERIRGTILGQTPFPGQLALAGGEVRLTLSLGPERRPVPDVMRLRADRAITVLQATGFRVIADSVEADAPAGQIVSIWPEPGTEVTLPTDVEITISLGPPMLELPDLSGMQEEQARELLNSLGFTVAEPVETRFRFGFNQGQVLEQFPPAGELAPRGSEVRLVVGRRGFLDDEEQDR